MRHCARRCILFVAIAAWLAACGKDEDALTGVFAGNAQLTVPGVSVVIPLRVNLSQSGSSVSGNFEATDPNGTTGRGTVNGSVSGSAVTLAFAPTTAGDCPAQANGTYDATRIAGTLSVTCAGQAPVPGTIDLVKQ